MDENKENVSEEEVNDKESEAFNSMLNAAQKKLGIEQKPEEAPADNGEAPAADGADASADGGDKKSKFTQAQLEALLGDDEAPEAQAAPDAEGAAPADGAAPENGEAPAAEGELGYEDDDTDEIASILGKSINVSLEDQDAPKEEPVPEKPKKNILGPVITAAAVVVALALGFCVSMLMFSDIIKSDSENFAIRAANAVNSKLPINSELYIFRSYVKKSSGATECMLYYAVCYDSDIRTDMCKVTVTNDKPNTVNVYYTVDENSADYLAMKQSDDAEVRLQASFLKNYSDSVHAADKLIQIDSPQWEKVDCTKINRSITSQQDKNAVPAQTKAAAASEGNDADIDDIPDIEE